jgi:hypothetical protein
MVLSSNSGGGGRRVVRRIYLSKMSQLFALVDIIHCKKELAIFPSPVGMSLTKLSLGGKKLNYSRPGRV